MQNRLARLALLSRNRGDGGRDVASPLHAHALYRVIAQEFL